MSSAVTGKNSSQVSAAEDPTIAVAVAALRGSLLTSLGSLVVFGAAGLAMWLASGQTGSSVGSGFRIGAITWVQGHLGRLEVGQATITLIPLGLTALLILWSGSSARRVIERVALECDLTSTETDGAPLWRMVAVAAALYAAAYGVAGLLVGVGASSDSLRPNLPSAFFGPVVVALLGFAIGLLRSTVGAALPQRYLPEVWLTALRSALVGVVALLVLGGGLVAVRMFVQLNDAATVMDRLDAGVAGGIAFTLGVCAYVLTFATWGAAYLVGPGFSVGTGTTVSVAEVSTGPVPTFPILTAIPESGAQPGWLTALLILPVIAGAVMGWSGAVRRPSQDYLTACGRALLAGLVAAAAFAALCALASGSMGPGRMSQWGPGAVEPFGFAVISLSLGSLLGAVVAHLRRSKVTNAAVEEG